MYNQNYNPYYPQPTPIQPMVKPFDFNGKWVNSIEEVEQINNENLPVISLDRNKNMFYMRINNELKAYEFKEVKIQTPQEKEIEDLKAQIASLNSTIATLNDKMVQSYTQAQNVAQTSQKVPNKKGVSANE